MTEEKVQTLDEKSIVVVGGGISGLTTAIEAAEAGQPVTIVEQNAYLGGRVAQNYQYFPKMCPPTCGLEINFQRIRKNPAIRYYTLEEVEKPVSWAGAMPLKNVPRGIFEKKRSMSG